MASNTCGINSACRTLACVRLITCKTTQQQNQSSKLGCKTVRSSLAEAARLRPSPPVSGLRSKWTVQEKKTHLKFNNVDHVGHSSASLSAPAPPHPPSLPPGDTKTLVSSLLPVSLWCRRSKRWKKRVRRRRRLYAATGGSVVSRRSCLILRSSSGHRSCFLFFLLRVGTAVKHRSGPGGFAVMITDTP